MLSLKNIKFISFIIPIVTLFCSCNNEFKGSDYVAYFGGEIVNPKNTYVLFCKDNEVIDTLKLDKNNRFFILFDSLAPGMYTFKHEREYQYVYFDKNNMMNYSPSYNINKMLQIDKMDDIKPNSIKPLQIDNFTVYVFDTTGPKNIKHFIKQ